MSLSDAEHLAQMHPWLRERVERALAAFRRGAGPGEEIKLVESVRPLAVQRRYYAEGRSKADGVSAYSLHQFEPALAADAAVTRRGKYIQHASDPAWERWAACAEAEGLEAGKRWARLVDCPHVQVPERERVRLLQAAVGATVDGDLGPATAAAVKARTGLALRAGKGWASVTLEAWAAATSA